MNVDATVEASAPVAAEWQQASSLQAPEEAPEQEQVQGAPGPSAELPQAGPVQAKVLASPKRRSKKKLPRVKSSQSQAIAQATISEVDDKTQVRGSIWSAATEIDAKSQPKFIRSSSLKANGLSVAEAQVDEPSVSRTLSRISSGSLRDSDDSVPSDRRKTHFMDVLAMFKVHGPSIQETDLDAQRTFLDSILFKASNAIAADSNVTFKFLGIVTLVSSALQAWIWWALCQWSAEEQPDVARFQDFTYWDSWFETIQLVMSQGRDTLTVDADTSAGVVTRIFYLVQVFSGLVIFAVFVGFITDSVTGFMDELAEGRTKVVASGHTLILGWNEATIRVVCQIAFLRRQYQMMNEVWHRKWFPWRRLPPSTPLAAAEIVILSDRFEKKEMDEMLLAAMTERGISPKRTRVGSDVICRVGDPTKPHDLVRVSAGTATSILVMMTHHDQEEADESGGTIENSASIRTLLALRRVLYADERILQGGSFEDDFRIVVQLSTPVAHMSSTYFTAPCGRRVIYPVDLTQFLNSLMFSCSTQPGLARVLMEVLNFEKPSIRKRLAEDLIGGPQMKPGGLVGMTFREAAEQVDKCIIIGIVDPNHPNRRGDGIVPTNPDRILRPDDLVIFVGLASMPPPDRRGLELAAANTEEAVVVKKRESQRVLHKKNIMVCGWRQIWSVQRKRFAKRIEDVTAGIADGSTIVFVNELEQDEFIEVVREGGFECLNDPADPTKFNVSSRPGGWIVARQVLGDPMKIEVLRPLMSTIRFDSTIVLGTQAGVNLPDAGKDMRVLNIMLLLRHLLAETGSDRPMHVVGENNLDDTADLALAPLAREGERADTQENREKNRQADFINTQAIIARTLVQTLANPIINPAVKELFDNSEGLPFVYLPYAEVVVQTGREMTFGVVQQAVRQHFKAHTLAICIGYTRHGEDPHIAPSKRQPVMLSRGDTLICIMRSVS